MSRTAERGLRTDLPPAPPVPQWLRDAADSMAAMYCPPRVSLYGLLYAGYIAGWQAAQDPSADVPPEIAP